MEAVNGKSTINWLTMKPTDVSTSPRQEAKASPASSNSSDSFAKVFSQSKKKSETLAKKSEAPTNDDADMQETESAFDRRPLPPGQDRDFSKRGPDKINDGIAKRVQSTDVRPAAGKKDFEVRSNEKEIDESVDNLERRQALQSLLKKMHDELGVDAEAIVAAFASLTPQELRQPPEMTLEKVIQALPLDPAQQAQAKVIFQDMLKQTAVNGMSDYLKGSHRQLSLEVLSQREAQRREIGRGVEKMQNQFFGPQAPVVAPLQQNLVDVANRYTQQKGESEKSGVVAPMWQQAQTNAMAPAFNELSQLPVMQPQAQTSEGFDISGLGMESVTDDTGEDVPGLGQTAAPQQMPAAMTKKQVAQAAIAAALAANSESSEASTTTPAQSELAKSFFEKQFSDKSPAPIQAQAGPAAATPAPPMPPVVNAPAMPSMSLAMPKLGGDDAQTQDEAGNDAQNFSTPGAELLQKAPGQSNVQKHESFVINTQPTQTQEAKNIREIVSQAQFLAQKGGGEMKVSLNPEGLGQVNMKVAVKGGQISVEMVADSSDAKRVLERGIGELKSSLMAHNLKVDQIRVDVPSDISRHLGQQNDEAQRQFAQQFLEQFRQDNREWRGAFTDISGAKAYSSQRDEAEQGQVPSSSNRRRGESRRLDLVA